MPKSLSEIRNYPTSQGTTQALRALPALRDPSYVQLDERQLEDILGFAQQFANRIRYYNLNNVAEGTWSQMLASDVSSKLAKLASIDLKAYSKVWDKLDEKPSAADSVLRMSHRFDFLFHILYLLADSYESNSTYGNYSEALVAIAKSADIGLLFQLSKAYYEAALAKNLITVPYYEAFSHEDVALLQVYQILPQVEQERYALFFETSSVNSFDASLIFGDTAVVEEQLQHALEYQKLLADSLLKILAASTQLAKEYLQESLAEYNQHSPHVALFLSFLRLQEEFQAKYNGLLSQHTDFYYKEVLRLQNQAYRPDEVFVYFELAKNQATYLAPLGTLLKGGKDSKGKDVYYQTKEQIVLNKAHIAAIKSFTYISSDSTTTAVRPAGIYAAAIANSKDGKGAKLGPGESWSPFASAPSTAVGVGTAFSTSLLRELSTDVACCIYIYFDASQALFSQKMQELASYENILSRYTVVEVFTEKEAQEYKNTAAEVDQALGCLKVPFTTTGLSKSKIRSEGPSASVIMRANSVDESNVSFLDVCDLLRSAHVSKIEVEIQNHVVEALFVDTPIGLGNAKEGFFPFGPDPRVKNSFSLSADILKGRIVKMLSYEGATKEAATKQVSLKAYRDINEAGATKTIASGAKEFGFEIYSGSLTPHSGKVSFELEAALGHESYLTDFTVVSTQGTNSTSYKVSFPTVPYTPFFKNTTLKVTVSELAQAYYHRYAFGFEPIPMPATLCPDIQTEGELYLGIKEAAPGEGFSILFQLNEGSADPELEAATVQWSYRSSVGWQIFEEGSFIDGTDNFTKSGIVKGSWPDDAYDNTLLFEEPLWWIRATVAKGQVNAVCHMVGVHTQAVLAQFVPQPDNAPEYLGTQVQGSFVTELFPKVSAVKALYQPYPSFNGLKTEDEDAYYLRVSERLRHKKRAVTQWDIEHLLVQQFPELYKVKCLIHSGKEQTLDVAVKAGNILVAVLPYDSQQSTRRFQPKVNIAVLRKIKHYVLGKISPFAQVEIVNPIYEEVRITLSCVFKEDIRDKGYYQELLLQNIQAYLSPWTVTHTAQDLLFDKSIYKAALLDYIEELPYIDYVTELLMAHGGHNDKDEAIPLSAIGILTSAATHTIHAFLASDPNS